MITSRCNQGAAAEVDAVGVQHTHRQRDRQTDTQTDRQTHIHTHTHTHRQIHRHTHTQTDTQTHTHRQIHRHTHTDRYTDTEHKMFANSKWEQPENKAMSQTQSTIKVVSNTCTKVVSILCQPSSNLNQSCVKLTSHQCDMLMML